MHAVGVVLGTWTVLVAGAGVAAEPTSRPATAAAAVPAAYEGYRLLEEPRLVAAVALRVNTRTITVEDVLEPLAWRLAEAGKQGALEDFRRQAAELIRNETERQVAEAMMLAEATKALDDQDNERIAKLVAERVQEMVNDAGGARAQLDARLHQRGGSLEELTESVRRQYTMRYYFEKRYLSGLAVTRKEMARYYQEQRAEFSSPARARMQVMAFLDEAFYPPDVARPTEEQRRQARQQARLAGQDALARIRAGEDFGEVVKAQPGGSPAYRAAEGGLLDAMPAGSFRETAVEERAFAQKPGQVSDLIEGETGVFIVKTVELQAARVTSFEQAQADIHQKLRDRQYDQLRGQYLQSVRQKASIIPSGTFERDVLARAVQEYYRPVVAPAAQP